MPERYISKSSQETEDLGISLAKRLKAGDVLLLFGDLGAGKTTLTRGIAMGLAVQDDVSSPTFTIMQTYAASEGGLDLQHFDCYRLQNAYDWYAEGFDELLYNKRAISVIEWPENVLAALPEQHIRIEIKTLPQKEYRQFEFEFPEGKNDSNHED